MDSVAIAESKQDLKASLREGLQLLGGFGRLKPQVIIKPNICTEKDDTGHSVTDVKVVEAVVDLVLEQDDTISIKIVESDSQSKTTETAFEMYGYQNLAETKKEKGFDVSLVNLSKPPFTKLILKDAKYEQLDLSDLLFEPSYFISVAVAKTHPQTFLTGSLKNQFGLVPRKDQGFYHKRIDDIIVDLNRLANPNLSIIDARVGIEGWNGPKTRELGCFILGYRPVSVDATMARVMGFEPSKVSHIIESSRHDLGALTPKIRGLDIDSVKVEFKAPF